MRRFLAPIFILTALVWAPIPVSAQQTNIIVLDQHPSWLDINDETKFSIRVSDDVKNGCWKNAEAAKNAVAIELQRSGHTVDISEDNTFVSQIVLYAMGYQAANASCVVSLEMALIRLGISSWVFDEGDKEHNVTSFRNSKIWNYNGVVSGPKNGMNQRIKEVFVEFAQKLLLDIPKQRGKALKAMREAAEASKDTQPEAYRYWMAFPE